MDKRRQLSAEYKERTKVGGVFRIVNDKNGRFVLLSAPDLAAARNRHEFSVNMNSCVLHKLRADWQEHGARAFRFETLEELSKAADQSDGDFADDLRALEQLWREKLGAADEY